MAEVGRNAYATTALNAAASSPTVVAVVNDGTADRQVVTLGAGDGTNALYSATNPLPVGLLDVASAAISIGSNGATSGQITGLNGTGTATIQLTGTFVATLNVQVTVDGTNWVSVTSNSAIVTLATGAYVSTGSVATTGVFQVDISGCSGIRVISISYTSGTVAGIIRTSAAGSLTALNSGLPTGNNVIGSLSANQSVNAAQVNGVTPLMGNGVTGTGSMRVTLASDTSSNTNPFLVNTATRTTGGATSFTLNAAASTNATSVKVSAGTLYAVELFNNAAYDVFFKMYNLATSPTVGSSTIYRRYKVPAGGGVVIQYGDLGVVFGTGIAIATTKLQADADATALVAGDMHVNLAYA